jgi:hypothetical protein
MKSYLILKEKPRSSTPIPKCNSCFPSSMSERRTEELSVGFSQEKVQKLKDRSFDAKALSDLRLPYEQLDQKLFDILMGVA